MIKTGRIQEQLTPCVVCGKPSDVESNGNMYCRGCKPVTDKLASDTPAATGQASTPFSLASEQMANAHRVK